MDTTLVEQLQESIIHALRLHLLANHPDDAFLFPRLLQKLADLRELVTEHAQLVQEIKRTEDTSLHPLLQEIYRDMYWDVTVGINRTLQIEMGSLSGDKDGWSLKK